MEKEAGKVKFYRNDKGFGFIARDTGGEIFFHITDVEEGYIPQPDDEVLFTIGEGRKGPIAMEVDKL